VKLKRLLPVFLFATLITTAAAADESLLNQPDRGYDLALHFEYGAVKVFVNQVQFGSTDDGADRFDYVLQGGEEILFPFQRYSADLTLADRHTIVFLYQPLTVVTRSKFREDVTIDGITFPTGTSMELTYGFPFWRLSYLYDFVASDSLELAAGLSLQLRNASIVFASLDGEALTINQNLGPVPVIKLRGSYRFDGGAFVGAEVDGFYASSAFFNGADFDFEGSVLDASLRGGVELKSGIDAFLNLRFLGGTAKGESTRETTYWTEGIEDYTENYLATTSLTLGFSVR
jgi:hypothetical protein